MGKGGKVILKKKEERRKWGWDGDPNEQRVRRGSDLIACLKEATWVS